MKSDEPRLARRWPTLVEMLAGTAAEAAQAEALVCGARRLDYATYLACVAGFANELEGLGAGGERVATLLVNSVEACIAAFAALAAGAQHVPLNPLYTEHEIEPILQDAAPRVLIVDAACAALAEGLASRLGIAHVIVVGEQAHRLDSWRAGEVSLRSRALPQALALLQYTGGTTGRAKGVDLTHAAIAVNVAQREALLPSRRGDRILCMMPLSHSYGMAMGLFLAANCGGTLVILPRYQADEVLAAVQRERINVFPGSPTVFSGLMAHTEFAHTDWGSVHTCYSGSAPLAAATLERWRSAVGAPVHEGYGLTEAGPVLSFNPAGREIKPGSVGIPAPQTEIQIVDVLDGKQVLAAGQRGEIRARGPQIMQGYRQRPQETAAALRDGWLYTGDIGELDADGYLYIRDRKKDMVIVGGYNVYPREVEEVLFAHPAVSDAAVIGVADAYRGEVLLAYVVLRAGAQADSDTLLAHCRAHLARYKIPALLQFTQALPKTKVNKTDKTVLRQMFGTMESMPSIAAPAGRRGAELITRHFIEVPQGTLHYATTGSGPPVLLLHQTPRSWDEYRAVLPLLAPHFRAIAMDTIGFGDSSKPPLGLDSIEYWAQAAISLVDALGIERLSVVGHHTGAVIAIEMAAAYPERIEAAVLSAAPLVDADFRMRHAGPVRIDNAVHKSDGSHLGELWRQRQPWYPPGDIDLLDHFLIDALKAGASAAEGHAVVARYLMENRLPLIHCPTLVIAPTADPHAYPHALPLAGAIANSRLVEIEGGMVPLPEQMPERFAERVTEFLLDARGACR